MSRKLPQAIGQTLDQMRSSAMGGARAEVRTPGNGASMVHRSLAAPSVVEPVAARPSAATPDAATVAAQKAAPDKEPDNGKAIQPVRTPAGADDAAATLRRSQARELIERHAKYAAFSGLIPLPVVDVAGVTATVVHLAGALARLYGVAAQRDRTRAIVFGLLGGSAPVGLGALASSSLTRLIPGANLMGIAVTSITAAACTRSIGMVFLEHFESGGTLLDFKVEQGKAALQGGR